MAVNNELKTQILRYHFVEHRSPLPWAPSPASSASSEYRACNRNPFLVLPP